MLNATASLDETLHPLHRLWRVLPARRRRELLARGTAVLAPKPDRVPPEVSGGVAVLGEITRATGLGEGARLMARALESLGVASWLMDGGLDVPGEAPDIELPPPAPPVLPGAALVMHVNAPQMPLAMMRLGRKMIRRRRVVGYWAWELPALPVSWDVGFRFVHEIWVPSRFIADAVAQRGTALGLDVPVRIVPHPVATDPLRPARLDRAAFGLPADATIVLVSFSLASSFERKNPLAAIAAFRHAFGSRRDVLLLLKTGKPGHYAGDLDAMRAAAAGAANIRIETRTFSQADNLALAACCDILLSLHRSEGFGLVPAEAMLLAKPVVATGWSGNMDFMDAGTACLVGHRLIPAKDPRGTYEVPGAMWAEPDQGDAVAHLRRLEAAPDLRAAIGARGQARARAALGPAKLRDAVAALGLDVRPS